MIALNCFELTAVSGGWNNESATSSSRPSSSSAAKAKPKNRKSVRDIRRANSSKKVNQVIERLQRLSVRG
jgi:hypothetical protein